MDIFSKAFNWLAELSSKLPKIDFKTYFIIVLAIIAGTALIVALTLLGSNCRKIKKASDRVIKYLADKESVDDDNVSDFTAHCFSAKAPQSMRDAWVQFLGVRFGYPSEIVSEQNVFDKEVKKHRDVRANVFICIALVLVAAFAFWGFGTLESNEMGVIHCLGLLLSAILYIVLVVLERKQYKSALEAFGTMQEDLDAKVNLQVERNYAVDSSPITQIATILDDIIARNTSKYIEEEPEQPAEERPDETSEPEAEQPAEEVSAEDQSEETPAEEQTEEQPEQAEEPLEELEEAEEEQPVEETEETPEEEPVEETEEPVEEAPVEEETPEETEEAPEAEDEQPEEVLEEEVEEAEEQPEETDEEEPAEEETVQEEIEEEEEPAPEDEETPEEEPVEEPEELVADEPVEEEETPEEADEEPEAEAEEPEEEAEVIYHVDEVEDDEEEVNLPKLHKLPSLIDYMLSMNLSRSVKINFAMLLLNSYNKYKDIPEEKAIIVECMKKIIADLTGNTPA